DPQQVGATLDRDLLPGALHAVSEGVRLEVAKLEGRGPQRRVGPVDQAAANLGVGLERPAALDEARKVGAHALTPGGPRRELEPGRGARRAERHAREEPEGCRTLGGAQKVFERSTPGLPLRVAPRLEPAADRRMEVRRREKERLLHQRVREL